MMNRMLTIINEIIPDYENGTISISLSKEIISKLNREENTNMTGLFNKKLELIKQEFLYKQLSSYTIAALNMKLQDLCNRYLNNTLYE